MKRCDIKAYIKILIALASLCLAVVILFTPLAVFLLDKGFYDRLYRENAVYEVLDEKDVRMMTGKVHDFFLYRGGLEGQVRFADPSVSYAAGFTDEEVSHMEDVRKLIRDIFITYGAAAVLFIILLVTIFSVSRGSRLKKTGLIFLWPSSATLLMFLVLLVLATNFYSLFDNFHLLFFPQGNYMFPEGSLLITMFPLGFFFQFFIRLAVSSTILAASILVPGIIFTVAGYRKDRQT